MRTPITSPSWWETTPSFKGCKHFLEIVYSKHNVLREKMHTTKDVTTHTNGDFLRTFLHLPRWNSASDMPTAEFVQAWGITALLSVSSSLGPSIAINIFHRCLLGLSLLLVLADSWLACVPSWVGGLLSTSSELVEGTRDNGKKASFLHCLSQHYTELRKVIGPACKWMVRN